VADTSLLLLGVILANNFVLPRALGFDPFRDPTIRLADPWKMGLVTAGVLIPVSTASHLIDRLVLAQFDIAYLWLVVTMLVTAAFVQLVGIVYRARDPRVRPVLPFYLALITTNCTILAVGVAAPPRELGLFDTLIHAIVAAGVFTAAIAMFDALCERVDAAPAPRPFRGEPLTLIGIGLTLLAFMGLTGVPWR
jgi:electron transport complex protein RnfA